MPTKSVKTRISKKPTHLRQWIKYLESLPSGYANKSLENLKKVASKLNLLNINQPSRPYQIITVGGTNGKGSCVVMLEAILLAAGYKVGAYISPHVLEYNERIRINGKKIDDESLCKTFSIIKSASESLSLPSSLSYFEFSTLTALYLFKQHKLDVLILEVGLGGRFDAVNLIDADISIITTISLEHTQLLGNTREAIGEEKAGIMRKNKPLICGDIMPPKSILEKARHLKSPLYCANREFAIIPSKQKHKKEKNWQWQYGKIKLTNLPVPQLPLQDAATALMAIYLLQQKLPKPIAHKAIVTGLKNAFLLGRFQIIKCRGITIILDVAHNPESTSLLAKNLIATPCLGKTFAIVSMLKDKDITSSLSPLAPIVNRWFIGIINSPRAATSKQLLQNLKAAQAKNIRAYSSIRKALQQAIALATKKDRIVIFGSFYTVAEALKKFG